MSVPHYLLYPPQSAPFPDSTDQREGAFPGLAQNFVHREALQIPLFFCRCKISFFLVAVQCFPFTHPAVPSWVPSGDQLSAMSPSTGVCTEQCFRLQTKLLCSANTLGFDSQSVFCPPGQGTDHLQPTRQVGLAGVLFR